MNDVTNILAAIETAQALLDVTTFDHEIARQAGEAIADIAQRESLPISVAVFLGDQTVYQAAFAGTTEVNGDWIRRKRNTVLRFGMSSLELALQQLQGERDADELDQSEFAAAGGAVPVRIGGEIVGVIAVSGLADTRQADDDLIVRALTNSQTWPVSTPVGPRQESTLLRVCYQVRVRPELVDEYVERHREVWPEMLAELAASGRRNYSIFLRSDGQLTGYFEVDDLEASTSYLTASETAGRWEAESARFFEAPGRPDQTIAPLREVFHLAGHAPRRSTGRTPAP